MTPSIALRRALGLTAELVGVGAEHIRKLRHFARLHVREVLAEAPELTLTVARVAERLGGLADRASFDRVLAEANLPSTSDPAGLLAVYLAGPYRPVPGHLGWWAVDPAEVVEVTRRLIRDGGGVHDRGALVADLEVEGISSAVVDAWLGCQPVRVEGELVVSLAGRATDIAARVLEATGRAMTLSEIGAWMPTHDHASTLVADLRRHSAFVQTGPDCWELAEWGGERSTHVIRWCMPVTASAIDGDEGDAPGELVAALGLRVDQPTRLATRYGPIALAYDGRRVVRSSARPIILASGARVGDTLIIVVDITGQAVGVELDRCGESAG